MGVVLQMDIVGERVFDRTLSGLAERAEDLRPVWDSLADRFENAEKRQFRSEGRYGSGGWQPLSDDYAAWKDRVAPGKPIMELTGDLKKDLTTQPFALDVREPHLFMVGTMDPKARWHQEGAGRNPQRKVVSLPESEKRQWVKTMQRYFVTGKV